MSDDHLSPGGPILLGSALRDELPVVPEAAALPVDARLVVVEVEADQPRERLRAVRERCPKATIVAYVPEEALPMVPRLLEAGYDEVAVGLELLRHRIRRLRQEWDRADRAADKQLLYTGLVRLIKEFAIRPSLHDVLRFAVVHMAELFGIDRVNVVIPQPDRDVAFVVMEHEEELVENVVIRLADYPELKEVMRRKEPVLIPDVFGDELMSGVRGKLEKARMQHKTAMLFPLVRQERVLGVLFLRSKERRDRIDDMLFTLGQLVASLTSIAVGHALEQDMLLSQHRELLRSKAKIDAQLSGLREFREFLDHAYDGILVTDGNAEIRYANRAASFILRRSIDELKGLSFQDLLIPRCHSLAERAMRGDAVGDPHGYVDLIVGAGEDEIVISAAVRSLSGASGGFVSFRDVTDLREIESELRQTKEFLENLIQSSVDGIVAAEVDGRIILFNRAAEQILGYSAREVVGKLDISVIYPPGEARDVLRRQRSEAFGGRGRMQPMRKDLVSRRGEMVPVNLTAAIIYEGGEEVATVNIFSDLRERMRIEAKLTQAQRQLQTSERQAVAVELAGAAAHELNQPLTSIVGYADMLRRRGPEGRLKEKAIETICREAERMAKIVRKIGHITAYQTKPYVGGSHILDFDPGSSGSSPPLGRPPRGENEE